jgi:2-succinyl-5-enolpyruvyl-6-hydroxy-3-cyclohexene-1-carboxylate synthase
MQKFNPADSKNWLDKIKIADEKTEKIKTKIINSASLQNEPAIVNELIRLIPDNSILMISNSLPIRDFDNFASTSEKNIQIFHNRGSSGIDGITSTALGLTAERKKQTILLTGDIAFFHDLNGLLLAKKYKIPLIIILINNNGGGIFSQLPISGYKDIFKNYFQTPLNIDFSSFTKAFSGTYKLIDNKEKFRKEFNNAIKRKNFSVLELKTDTKKSYLLRKNFRKEINITIK